MEFPVEYSTDSDGYSVVPQDGSTFERADDGSPRIRRLWAQTRYDITFRIYGLDAIDVSVVMDFYADNHLTTVEWLDPFTDITYSAMMLAPPRVVATEGPWAVMEIRMEGVVA